MFWIPPGVVLSGVCLAGADFRVCVSDYWMVSAAATTNIVAVVAAAAAAARVSESEKAARAKQMPDNFTFESSTPAQVGMVVLDAWRKCLTSRENRESFAQSKASRNRRLAAEEHAWIYF